MSRIVLITGCSSGIGQALARAFAANGDTVIATARRVETLAELQTVGCVTLPLDVNSVDSQAALREMLAKRSLAHVDVLIHNAGISAMGPMLELPADKLRGQFDTNVFAPVLLTQALFPLLRAAPNPVVAMIGSVSGILVTPFAGAYCASKAALHAIAEAMRMELAPLGVQVVTVQPGAIESNFGAAARESIESWLGENSLYAPIRDGIMTRAGASQVNATPAAEFADELVRRLAAPRPAAVIRIGHGSRSFPALARWLPRQRLARLLSRKFGLNRLGA